MREQLDEATKPSPPLPNQYEELLEALPLPVPDARTVVAGARLGLLHETLAAVIIRSCRLPPVLDQNIVERRRYYRGAMDADDCHPAIFASLSAFMYWDCHWNRHRLEKVRTILLRRLEDARFKRRITLTLNAADFWEWTEDTDREHEQWCQGHFINPKGVLAVSRAMEESMKVLFLSRFEPEFLRCQRAQPRWLSEDNWRVRSILVQKDMLFHVYGDEGGNQLRIALRSLLDANGDVCPAFMTALEVIVTGEGWRPCEVRLPAGMRDTGPIASLLKSTNRMLGTSFGTASCSRFLSRPPTENFEPANSACGGVYSFDRSPDAPPDLDLNVKPPQEPLALRPIAPNLFNAYLSDGAVGWFKRAAPNFMMLGDGDFSFSKALVSLGYPPRVASTKRMERFTRWRSRYRYIDATRLHQTHWVLVMILEWSICHFAWNFPEANGASHGDENKTMENKSLIMNLLCSLSLLMEKIYDRYDAGDSLLILRKPVMLGLSLHNDQFSRWSVLRSAQQVGWQFQGWCHFNHEDFPGYCPKTNSGKPMSPTTARFYLFLYTNRYCDDADVS